MLRFFHYLIATALGAGFVPKAPGTAGALLGLLLFWFIPMDAVSKILLILFFFLLGVWSSGFIEKERGTDPPIVVIDEVVGQWTACLFVPHTLVVYALAFVFFRLFDIWKPFPIDDVQRLKGGWGIMVDDFLAGLYALGILGLILLSGVLS